MKSFKVYLESAAPLCESNIINTSRIFRYIRENNHEIIYDPSKADFIIINSCGFVKKRQDLCIHLFNSYYSIKKEDSKILMFGCLININKKLIDSLDVNPIFFDEGEKLDKIFYRNKKFEDTRPISDPKTNKDIFLDKNLLGEITIHTFFISKYLFYFFRKARHNFYRFVSNYKYNNKLFVEISKGCTGNCSYCAIKKARGSICSRQIKDIISDIENYHDPSKSLFLVADDCGCYGLDIGTNFFYLIYEINKRFPDLSIEIDSLDPYWIEKYAEDYIRLFKRYNIYIATIPVQSGSNKILRKMNRKYDIYKVMDTIDKIKKASPNSFIVTNYIIGFPGENPIDFIKSMFSSIHFDFSVVLKYSEHKGLKSSTFPKHKSLFTMANRYTIFSFFLNFVHLIKFSSFPIKKTKEN